MRETRATAMLVKAGIRFALHSYSYDPDTDRAGLHAAEALGVPPEHVLKTLVARVDGRPVCAVLPSDRELSMKRLAAVFGGKSAEMMSPPDAERLPGYVVGGISPFGQKRPFRIAFAEEALQHELVFLNAGRRGLQVALSPHDAVRCLGAVIADLVRPRGLNLGC